MKQIRFREINCTIQRVEIFLPLGVIGVTFLEIALEIPWKKPSPPPPPNVYLLLIKRMINFFSWIYIVMYMIPSGCPDPSWSLYGSCIVSQTTSYDITNHPPSGETCLHHGTQVSKSHIDFNCLFSKDVDVHLSHTPILICTWPSPVRLADSRDSWKQGQAKMVKGQSAFMISAWNWLILLKQCV